MIVGMDATPLTVETGGVCRYTAQLASSLAATFPDDTVHLLSDQPFSFDALARNLDVHPGPPGRSIDRRWWSVGLPRALRRLRAAVFHGTDFSVPYAPLLPAVMTLHDLSPWRDPAWHDGATRVRRRTPVLLRLGSATLVITPSEAVRREALDFFALHPARVIAIAEAAAPVFRPETRPEPRRPYLLYAGTLEPRKNIGMAIDAWRNVKAETGLQLVLAGRERRDFRRPPAELGLEFAGAVTDTELARLYSGAAAVLYPSLYEGFGLPVLEAMQCGAPVIASRDPALLEVAGDAAIHVDATDLRGWIAAVLAVTSQPDLSRDLRAKAIRRAASFSWAGTARRTREVYQEAIRRFHA
jgi:glycosyltransferase involved in cell wall biosynthesis